MASSLPPQVVQLPERSNRLLDAFQGASEGGTFLHVWSDAALIHGFLVAKCSCGYYTPPCDRVIDLESRMRLGCPVESAVLEGQRHRAQVWDLLGE